MLAYLQCSKRISAMLCEGAVDSRSQAPHGALTFAYCPIQQARRAAEAAPDRAARQGGAFPDVFLLDHESVFVIIPSQARRAAEAALTEQRGNEARERAALRTILDTKMRKLLADLGAGLAELPPRVRTEVLTNILRRVRDLEAGRCSCVL